MQEEDFKTEFGKSIKNLRKMRKLTQSELAEAIDLEPHNLNRIENGKSFTQLKTVIKIINYFDISPTELFLFPADENLNKIITMLTQNPKHIGTFCKILSAIIEDY